MTFNYGFKLCYKKHFILNVLLLIYSTDTTEQRKIITTERTISLIPYKIISFVIKIGLEISNNTNKKYNRYWTDRVPYIYIF